MRFGLEKDYEMNFDDITKEWNKSHFGKESLTQERVRQIVNEAIKKMK
jgi:DNA-directed RNA polymerase sigma subunit (sigma70/sigma32)